MTKRLPLKAIRKIAQIKQEIQQAVEKYFKNDKDILDWVYVDSGKNEQNDPYIEVRAELGYNSMTKLGDSLNKIVQKYNKDSYFEHWDSGIIRAYFPAYLFLESKLCQRLDNHLQNIKEESSDLQILRSIPGKDFSKDSVWAEFLNAVINCLTTGKFIPKPELTKISMKYYTDEIDQLIYHRHDDDLTLEDVISEVGAISDDWKEGLPGSLIYDITQDYKSQLSSSIIKELNKASDFLDSLGHKLYSKAVQYAKAKWKE